MNTGTVILLVVAALLVAGLAFVAGWLLSALRSQRERAGLLAERAGAEERRMAAEGRVAELGREAEGAKAAAAVLEAQLREETGRRAGFEERAAAAGRLENEVAHREIRLKESQEEMARMGAEQAGLRMELEKERAAAAEKLLLVEEARARLQESFAALSGEALSRNNQAFLDLAQATLARFQEGAQADLNRRQGSILEALNPVRESLAKVDEKIGLLERSREGAYAELREQVRALGEGQVTLRAETGNLVKALRASNVRGRWGEIQLRRVVELAGMIDHCDFVTQDTVTDDDGRSLRPDLVVYLPGGKNLVVDSKAPLGAYLEAAECADDVAKQVLLARHARNLREHVKALSQKSYFAQFKATPEFVVLFLPGEGFFSAALEKDPGLIEFGVEQNIVVATPTTLIALLRAASYGWRQENLAANAQKISELGRELYKRLGIMGDNMGKLGKQLGQAVESYNSTVATLETRVMVTARKFDGLDVAPAGTVLPELNPLDRTVRAIQVLESQKES